jgi:hypothetical protein
MGGLLGGDIKFDAHGLVNRRASAGPTGASPPARLKGHLEGVVVRGTLSGCIDGHGPSGKLAGTFTGMSDKSAGFGGLSMEPRARTNMLLVTSGSRPGEHHTTIIRRGGASRGAPFSVFRTEPAAP